MTSLLDLIEPPPVIDHKQTAQERFQAFHDANLHVYIDLRRLAFEWLDHGHDHCSIAMLYEVLRHSHGLRTKGDAHLLNNDFRAPYARMLAKSEPRLANVFEVRKSKYDDATPPH